MADLNSVRYSRRRVTPQPPAQAPTSHSRAQRSHRVTRSQSRDISDNDADQAAAKRSRRKPKQSIPTDGGLPVSHGRHQLKEARPEPATRANALQGENKNALRCSAPKNLDYLVAEKLQVIDTNSPVPRVDLPEAEEDSPIRHPKVTEGAAIDNNNNAITEAESTRRRSGQDARVSGAGSVFSGTTARTSRSGRELSGSPAMDMIETLQDLSDTSDKILCLLVPQEVSEASVQSIRLRLSNLKSRESKHLMRHVDFARGLHEVFGNERYIQASVVIGAMLDASKHDTDRLGPWRMDPILYKTNLTTLVTSALWEIDENIERSIDELDEIYPAPFLNGFVDATSIAERPDSSALLTQTFRLGLEIRTRCFIEAAKRNLGEPKFDPNQLLQQIFYRKGKGLHGWNVVGMRWNDLKQDSHLRITILDRLDQLRNTFSESEAPHVDIESLERDFSRLQFIRELIYWSQLRLQEVDKQLQLVEGAGGIVRNLQSMPADSDSLTHGSHDPRVTMGHRQRSKSPRLGSNRAQEPSMIAAPGASAGPSSYEFGSSKALKAKVHRLKVHEASRRASLDSERSQQKRTKATTSLGNVSPTADSFTPTGNARVPAVPVPAPARVQDRHVPLSIRESSVQLPPIGDDELDLSPPEQPDPQNIAEVIMRTQGALEAEGNKENLAIQPGQQPLRNSQPPSQREASVKKRHFLDRQENPERVGWDDTQDDIPASNPGRSVVEATQDQIPDEESELSEDGGFQKDERPIAQSNRILQTSSLNSRRVGQRPPAKRPRTVHRNRETMETDDIMGAVARHNNANAPPLSQIETYQQVNTNAKLVVAKKARAPRTRTFWSADETERLLELIQGVGTSWSLLQKFDNKHPDGPMLESRDQVALKDKANNMKMDYLKDGQVLPKNFESVVIKRRQIEELLRLGIEYDPVTGMRVDGRALDSASDTAE
ncbi:MAG: hypothetical protein Q9181_006781 [Wetmoreana brouardii]